MTKFISSALALIFAGAMLTACNSVESKAEKYTETAFTASLDGDIEKALAIQHEADEYFESLSPEDKDKYVQAAFKTSQKLQEKYKDEIEQKKAEIGQSFSNIGNAFSNAASKLGSSDVSSDISSDISSDDLDLDLNLDDDDDDDDF